jgi:hypothetical protein
MPVTENRCTHKTGSGRQCVLAVHTDKPDDHKYAERILPVLPAGFKAEFAPVTAGQVIKKESGPRIPGPRDDVQKQFDTNAVKSHAANLAKKNTQDTKFEELELSRIGASPDTIDAVLAMLRRTTQFGGPLYKKNAFLTYRKKTRRSGYIEVQFAMVGAGKPKEKPVK